MGEVFAILSALFFSTAGVTIRRGMRTSPDDGVFLSALINMVVFLILLTMLHHYNQLPVLTFHGFLLFIIAGLLTTFGGRSLHFAAIRKIGPSRAVPFRSSSPVFTIGLAFIFLSERLSLIDYMGGAAILGGIWFLSREVSGRSDLALSRQLQPADNPARSSATGFFKVEKTSLAGILLGIGAAASFGTGHFTRKLAMTIVPSPYWGAAIGSIAGWVAMTAQAVINGNLKPLIRYNFNFHSPPGFFLLAGVLTTFGQIFCFLAIFYTSVSVAMILISIEPLGTLIISKLLLGGEESLNWVVGLSAFVVVVGITLILI